MLRALFLSRVPRRLLRRGLRSLLLALALPGLCAGGDFARLARTSGPVWIKPLGHQSFVRGDAGASLIPGDAVKTGPSAIAHIEFDGGAILLVTAGSLFILGEEADNPFIDFKLGEWLFGLVKRLEAGRQLRVRTPQAVAAVRGTLFWGKTDPKETLLAGLEHEVEITAKGKTVTLKPGQLIRVPSGAAPAEPVPHEVPAPFLDRFRVEGGLGGVESLLIKKTNKKK